MTVIKDGTGRGFQMAVNAQNEALVKAIRATIEHTVCSRDGESYVAHTGTTANTLTISTGETIKMLYLENTSGVFDLVIEKITGSTSVALVVLTTTRNSTLGTATANNVFVPVNGNFSSGKQAQALCHSWDESGTTGIGGLTGGTKMTTHILEAGEFEEAIDGSIVLKRGNNIVISIVNGTGGDAECEVGIRFYYDRPEI